MNLLRLSCIEGINNDEKKNDESMAIDVKRWVITMPANVKEMSKMSLILIILIKVTKSIKNKRYNIYTVDWGP